MFLSRSIAVAPILLLSGACAEGYTEAVWDGTVTDSAGVQIVQNTENPIWRGESAWKLTEQLKIGRADGDPDYQFAQISGIVIGPNQNVYVLDAMAGEVKIFGPDGALLNRFGQMGSGPGELGQGAAPLLLGTGDTLFIPDLANQRVNLYDLDGASLGSYNVAFQDGIPVDWETTPSGTVVNQLRSFPMPGVEVVDSMDLIAVRNGQGEVVDTILSIPSGQTLSVSGGAPTMKIFSPEPLWTMNGDDGTWFAVNNQYRISLYDTNGDLKQVVTKPFEQKPVAEADRSAFLEALGRLVLEQGAPPEAIERFLSIVDFADKFPAFLQFMVGPEQSLWVQHVQTPSDLTEEELETYNPQLQLGSPDWDVFNSDGQFLGVIEMPPRFQPMNFTADAIYGIWRDELDVQYVMKLGIESGDG